MGLDYHAELMYVPVDVRRALSSLAVQVATHPDLEETAYLRFRSNADRAALEKPLPDEMRVSAALLARELPPLTKSLDACN